MVAGHGRLDGLGECTVANNETKPNVAVLGAVGEIGAGEQQDFVVDHDELRVADDLLAIGQEGSLVDGGARELSLDLGRLHLVAVDVNGDNHARLLWSFLQDCPHL